MVKKIYLSHPFGGKFINQYRVGRCMQRLVELHPNYLFISPIHLFGVLYHSVSYEKGLEYCLELLKECDELWILHDDGKSKGVAAEREFALKNGIPIKNFTKPW